MTHVPQYIFQGYRQGLITEYNSADVIGPPNNVFYVLPQLLLEHDQLIIGSIIYSIREIRSEIVAKLIDIEIEKKYRGKGYGKMCINWLITQSRRQDAVRLQLFVFKKRKIARSIYDSLGFEVVKTYMDGVKMTLDLSNEII